MPQTWNMIRNKGLEEKPKREEEGTGGDAIDTEKEPGGDTTDRRTRE